MVPDCHHGSSLPSWCQKDGSSLPSWCQKDGSSLPSWCQKDGSSFCHHGARKGHRGGGFCQDWQAQGHTHGFEASFARLSQPELGWLCADTEVAAVPSFVGYARALTVVYPTYSCLTFLQWSQAWLTVRGHSSCSCPGACMCRRGCGPVPTPAAPLPASLCMVTHGCTAEAPAGSAADSPSIPLTSPLHCAWWSHMVVLQKHRQAALRTARPSH